MRGECCDARSAPPAPDLPRGETGLALKLSMLIIQNVHIINSLHA
jgi:hypothetical protein